jgi:hypothetical protein
MAQVIRVPAWQAQDSEFELQYRQKKKMHI